MKALLAALLLMSSSAHAAYLHLCPADAAPKDGVQVKLADGSVLAVSSAPQLPGCRASALGVDASQVESLYPLAPGDTPARTILLYGAVGNKPFAPSSHDLPQPDRPGAVPQRRPVPLRANLLGEARVRPFGVEERVRAEHADGKLRLACGAGTRAAGVLIDGPWQLPLAELRLAARYSANGTFSLQAADEASAARETSHALGDLDAAKGAATLALPAALDRAGWRQFVLLCPSNAATLTLDALSLEPVPGKPQPRATWIWERAEWRDKPDALLAWARREAVRELFIVVPLEGARVREPDRLAAFVRRAGQAGIAVTAVEGDPHMVLPSQRAATVDRARAYAAYNRAAKPEERLRAMQFDVEPYLLDDTVLDPDLRDREYLAMAQALHAAAGGMPLEFVVPFWWWDKRALLDGLAKTSDGLAVMDYRTDPDQIVRFAVPFLDWGTRHGKGVHIALEAGRVAPELQRRYVRADADESGSLLVAQVGKTPVLVLLRQPVKTTAGTLYRLSGERTLDGSATSFHGNPERLRALLPRLERDFSAWSSFGGLALHGWRWQ
ncbi:hypothetical protein [Massilia sp. Mn16-1_5]|uniref:hypothetical protein n=1 Tax=Massilia sp. Mn16-1_5 TaxID=2079199 RepID=UPI00109E4541|nr:hypothetical protein [Massilia sp. Mn16-1_5]THC46151.1 hypothetical protein C2862_02685 [Massilia sp. Mn16-1_5]